MSIDECQSEASPNIDRLISYSTCQCWDPEYMLWIVMNGNDDRISFQVETWNMIFRSNMGRDGSKVGTAWDGFPAVYLPVLRPLNGTGSNVVVYLKIQVGTGRNEGRDVRGYDRGTEEGLGRIVERRRIDALYSGSIPFISALNSIVHYDGYGYFIVCP